MIDLEVLKQEGVVWDYQKKKPVNFIFADNMEFLRWCKRNDMFKYFHVSIVDPPYGEDITKFNLGSRAAERAAGFSYERGDWDHSVPDQEYWDLLWYVSRNIIAWGGNYFTKEINWSGRSFIVWDKKNDGLDFAAGELALTTYDKNPLFIRKSRNRQEQDGEKRHDTQKPVYLYDATHGEYVERNQRVLDTHGGSFSHSIAAWKHNHELWIMDKQRSYYDNGIAAFDKATVAPRLLF